MLYLEPEHVLGRFSEFVLSEVRPAIDDEFLKGQVGSVASTLRFLSMELADRTDAIERQHDTLLDALEEVAATAENEPVVSAARAASDELTDVSDLDTRELEERLLAAGRDVLAIINENLAGDDARRARRPMYEFLDTRVQTQLELMGRER